VCMLLERVYTELGYVENFLCNLGYKRLDIPYGDLVWTGEGGDDVWDGLCEVCCAV
jgi:hypothetical protein